MVFMNISILYSLSAFINIAIANNLKQDENGESSCPSVEAYELCDTDCTGLYVECVTDCAEDLLCMGDCVRNDAVCRDNCPCGPNCIDGCPCDDQEANKYCLSVQEGIHLLSIGLGT